MNLKICTLLAVGLGVTRVAFGAGEPRSALQIAAYDATGAPSKQVQTRAEDAEAEKNLQLMFGEPMRVVREAKPQAADTIACELVSVKNIEIVTVEEPKMVEPQAFLPKANGTFIKQRRFNEDAFVVSFPGRFFRHRETFHLNNGAIVYQEDKLTKIEFFKRGDAVEVAFIDTGKKYLAVEVEINKTATVVASK